MTSPTSTAAPASARAASLLNIAYFVCLFGLTAALGVMIVRRPLSGWLDFWAHAAIGRWIWENGRVPDTTLFLWSASEPWVYHSWLSQLCFFALTCVGGPEHFPQWVLGFTVLMVFLPFVFAVLLQQRVGRLSCFLVVPIVFALKGLALRFQTRPELFTGVLLAFLLVVLTRWYRPGELDVVRRRDKFAAVGLLLLFWLWANLHGGVLLGILVLAVFTGCEMLQTRFGPRSRLLALVAVLSPLAVCANPYGFGYWRAFRPVANAEFATSILEWKPVWQPPILPDEMLVMLAVVVPPAVLAWSLNPERRWSQLGLLLLLGALFLTARRNIWPFTLGCIIVLAANARTLAPESWARRSRRFPAVSPRARWAVRMCVLLWVGLECLLAADRMKPWQTLTPRALETGLARFVEQSSPPGRIFNDYENSSYLNWRFRGKPPLFIDLLNAYPDRLMRDYAEMAAATERGRELFEEYGIGMVMLTTNRGGSSSLVGLASRLDASPRWVRVYAGNDGVAWVRRTEEYRRLWEPRLGTVKTTDFAVLERWAVDENELAPAGAGMTK